ncbi:hypothetical protein M9Y10_013584 [Tritrichomonas musculus]|uniref:HECT domain-containing protein n=1 Tax=Tritrichomonas musculus TaxID=1915356 RepID=A0ABR2L0C4_9EUKA
MNKNQEIFIKSKNSDYLHEIVQKKDWETLIELASSRDAFSDLILNFFSNDECKPALKGMTEKQLFTLIDASPANVSNNILDRIESICDTDSKFTDIAVKLMKGVYTHGGDLSQSSIVKCLPINIIRIILDSRIPVTEFHFGSSRQEFFMHINSTLIPNSTKNFNYKNLKERDCTNGVFTYIQEELNSFPLSRRAVYKEVINALRDSFTYIEENDNLDYKQPFIREIIINPFINLIVRGLQDKVLDYKNDKEIIELLRGIFSDFYHSKYYRSCAAIPISTDLGNTAILNDAKIFEDCKVISPNYFYKVFKKAVELNEDNFIDSITRVFFTNCRIMHHVREMNDGVYDKLFNAAIEITVRELIERKSSENFERCCSYLKYNQIRTFNDFYIPRFDECLLFIKSVISMIFEKEQTLNVDVLAYPEICCYLLNTLNLNTANFPIPRNANTDVTFSLQTISSINHTALDLLDAEMRNKLVLGIIRHPTDSTKFSHIISSNNPTTLVNFICNFHSVQDIKLTLPEAKRNTLDKFGFREFQSAGNPKKACKMNLVEIFLQTLKFWENNDKSLFKDGYTSYFQFVRKILMESILTNDKDLKKEAIDVYYRFSELVSLIPTAKFINTRIQIASYTFLTPIAVIVGSELDNSFVEQYVKKFIQPFNAQSYQYILSQVVSQSHLNLNYFDDEKDQLDNQTDKIFKEIKIDEQMATATKLLLDCIKQNPVKNFSINYNHGIQEKFFISKTRILNAIKKKFDVCNPKILDVCCPLKTEYPLNITYNGPNLSPISIHEPEYKVSHLVFLELCRFIANEIKEYSPKMFKSNLTKSLIKIQNLIKDISKGTYDDFKYAFYLDQPTFDTLKKEYYNQSNIHINVLYSKPFFDFLNDINEDKKSIYNDESYEIIKNAFIAQFLNEEDYLQQKNKSPPKFNGFDISIQFKLHQNSFNIFNTIDYNQRVKDFKYQIYRNTNNMNQNLIAIVERMYNNTKLLGEQLFDDVFELDLSTHKSHELSSSQKSPFYKKNVHKCFIKVMDALNKCKAELFMNDFDSLERIQNFTEIRNYGSTSSSYTMLTHLLDLLINDFVSPNMTLNKTFKNEIVSYNDIYNFMVIVAKMASPNIGSLENLKKLCGLSEKTISQKVPNQTPELFDSIFRNGNIDQILLCMNSSLFCNDANNFYFYLLKEAGLLHSKEIINELINEVLNNEREVLDDFLVSLASCSIHPRFVGFPAPQSSLDFLKKIVNKSIYAKRAACANAVYYAIMCHTAAEQIPLKDIIEIIDSAHKKSPEEITAFFCIMINQEASLKKMNSLPALNDLMTDFALPHCYIINQSLCLNIPKEIGDLYYHCIEKIILSGLKSNKSHIYELTVTVLNEINVGPEIHQIISPFIEKGLNDIQPNDDNEAFLTYATSFTMKNPEFKGCFDSYCEALSKIKKHSFNTLKANTNLKNDLPYPEPFTKLEKCFSTIIDTIEKPFIEFKAEEEQEMISASQFCANLLPVLKKNRPAVARNVYLQLEAYASIFGDPLIKELVLLYKQDKKKESLSKFIVIITHHEELILKVPQSIRNIYSHLKSAFTTNHTIELSENLADSQGKIPLSMECAYELAKLISPDVLSHMPDSKSIENEDKVIEVLSNLGIFCKKNNEVIDESFESPKMEALPSFNNGEEQVQQHILSAPIPATGEGAYDGRTVRRLTKHYAVSKEDIKRQASGDINWATMNIGLSNLAEADNNESDFDESFQMECNIAVGEDSAADYDSVQDETVEECICLEASIPVNCEENEEGNVEDESLHDKEIENEESTDELPQESEGDDDLNQDQFNDAFDLFF